MKSHPFSAIITDVTSKFSKIKTSEYKAEGRFKIIDQGQKEIAGYTDDESLINKTHSPIIVFGDHTRALKYEDSPIALGADGAKALAINPKLADARYIYYYLRSIHLKEAGYSRHFKFLKQIEIPIPEKDGRPNLDDQKRIAHLLGKVEGLIARRKHHLQQLDDLLKSVFLEMFGDPVRNEKGWDTYPCEKAVLDISSGTSYGGEDRAFVSSDEVGVLKISAVTKGIFDPSEFKVVNPAQIKKALRYVKRDDFLFSRANTVELVAACCVAPQDFPQLFLPDKLWVLTLNHEMVNPQFFNYLLKNDRYRDVIRSLASGGHDSMLNISMKKFMTLSIPCPLIDLQNQFAAIVEKVESLKSRYQHSLTDLATLYGALSQKAFKGELDLSRVVLPVASTTEGADCTETHRKPKLLSQGFARQLLAAEILRRHNDRNMTQMKLQKLIHLSEYHARLDEIQGDYQRQAAGPFDNKMMYGIAAGLKKQQWFAMHGHGQNATYAPLLKAGAHEKYLPYWQDKISKIDEVLQLLGPLRPDQCEIVSTLYAAWNDLLIDGEAITDERIIEQASKAELWHKTKEAIDPDRWPKALQWMREHHLVPTSYGKHTRKLP